MRIKNYFLSLEEFSARYPMANYSSRVDPNVIDEFPNPSDRQNYVDRTYIAEDYLA